MNLFLSNLTAEQLREAARLKKQIEHLEHQMEKVLGGSAASTNGAGRKAKRKMSAVTAHKPKRKMSAAAKARLSAIAKARWKKAKAAGKSAL